MTNKYDAETQQIIADLDKQAKEIQAKIDELKNGGICKNVRWRAKVKSKFWALDKFGDVIMREEGLEHHHGDNDALYVLGNYFKTECDAEYYRERLIITQKIKDIALRLNNGVEIDYGNPNQSRYFIKYRHHDRAYSRIGLKQEYNDEVSYVGVIHCLSDKFLETCIEEIGEKELIEYIKGG